MKQQWVAMGVLVMVIMSLSMAAAECDEEERINQGRGGGGGQQQCDPSRLNDCRDFIRGGRGQGQDQPPRRCCQELQNMPRDCRCDAVQQIFEEEAQQYGLDMDFNQRSRGGGQQQQQRQMMERARQLPSRCNASPSRCDIRPRGIYVPGSIW